MHWADSIRKVLPAAFSSVQDLSSIAGGLAAGIAVGAFIGQAMRAFGPATPGERRSAIAIGGLIGLGLMIGIFLFSGK